MALEKSMLGFALAATALVAQPPAPNGPASGMVRLSAAVVGANGNPVTDLKLDEFQITDQGKPQKIAFFRVNAGAPDAAPLGPHEYSNRAGAAPHSTAILFDLLNQNQSDRLDAWRQVGRSLQQLESGDSLYLYLLTLEGNLTPVHAIGGKSGDDHTWVQQSEKEFDKAMKAASHARPAQMDDTELVVKKTYVALETLANQLAALPGHRDIVWITYGVPNVWNPKTPCNGDWVDCALYVPHLAVTLEHANVAVDPLSYTSSPNPSVTRDLDFMAGLTGGWTYFGEDIRSVLKHIASDATTNYSIFYDPGPENWDSKFHKVQVNLERKGNKIHSRQRYYGYPDRRPEAVKQQAALAAVFQSPFDDPAIGLRATVASDVGKTPQIRIRINPADLLLREEGGAFTGAVSLVVCDIGASGLIGQPSLSNFNIHLTREERDAAIKDGFPIAQDHAINESIQKVRLLVLDQGSTVAGSLTIPVGAGH